MRGGAGTEIGFECRDLVHESLIAIQRAVEFFLLAHDDVAELREGALEVREFFFDGIEAVGHRVRSDPILEQKVPDLKQARHRFLANGV